MSSPGAICLISGWLGSIGIEARFGEVADGAFLPHVGIQDGVLVIGPLATASNVLHEAGHLAVLPSHIRNLASGCVEDSLSEVILGHDRPECPPGMTDEGVDRMLIQSGDTEATAWAWAAGLHLGLTEAQIIASEDYEGEGEEVRFCLRHCSYAGIHGLAASGMTTVRSYPKMTRWVQP